MKNSILKRLTSFGLTILFFCVLSPLECFAYTYSVKMTVGDTNLLEDYRAGTVYETDYTYVWTIESGSDIVSFQSGTTSATCSIRAEKEGSAVVKKTTTKKNVKWDSTSTTTYNITVSMPTYTVTLDANGGSVSPSKVTIKDNGVISLPTPKRDGYSFIGWFTDAVSGSQINSGDSIHITGDSKLYAHWEQQQPGEISSSPSSTTTSPSSTTTPSNSSDDPFCSTCYGLGDCPKCFGRGYDDCSSCIMGRCTHCGGTGEILSYSSGGVKSRDCTYCHGSGSCSRCNGLGEIKCSRCSGKGVCPTCNGTGFKPGRSLDEYSSTTSTPSTSDVPRQNPTTPAPAANFVSVTVNGNTVQWTDATPFIDANSRTMVPLRAVADAMGLDVNWDTNVREASFTNGGKTIIFPIGSNTARTSNGSSVQMNTAAVIVNGRTYAPIRYMAEFFGYQVDWDAATQTVTIK